MKTLRRVKHYTHLECDKYYNIYKNNVLKVSRNESTIRSAGGM